MGELELSPRLPSRNRGRGPTSKGKGGRERGRRKEGDMREGEGIASSLFNFWLRASIS